MSEKIMVLGGQEYALRHISDFLDDEEKKRGWIAASKLKNNPKLLSDTAERDSMLARKQEIQEGVDWILFIDKDGIWCVYVCGGKLLCYKVNLAKIAINGWVACPSR